MLVRGDAAARDASSDAVAPARAWRAGFGYEFQTRARRLSGAPARLRPRVRRDRARWTSASSTARSRRQVDLVAGSATDGLIDAMQARVLADDKHAFPPYEAAPVVRAERSSAGRPRRRARVARRHDRPPPTMRRLNHAVDGEHQDRPPWPFARPARSRPRHLVRAARHASRVCVFCGSSIGHACGFADAAREFARRSAARGLGLVYGGGSIGLMGVLADAVLGNGGEVIGVIPRALTTGDRARRLTELRVVASMHERKATMAELADASSRCPAGSGRSRSCSRCSRGCSSAFTGSPWRARRRRLLGGLAALSPTASSRVRPRANAESLLVETTPDRLLDAIAEWTPPALPRPWLRVDET